MATTGYRLPANQSIEDTFRFLLWNQFPALLERSVEYFATLPQVGRYRHVNSTVKSFMDALHDVNGRQLTLSGVGSLIDYDAIGHQIKRPSPQLVGTGCEGNTLCLEPTCFGFTEGVMESNNILQNLCWTLQMPCVKDQYYSDTQFDRKMRSYFEMFFKQAPAVLEAYQRTRLLKEAIKVVATQTNVRFSGPVIGGTDGLSLPFYIDPSDPTGFPLLASIPGGVGGLNIQAFMNYVAPRLFSGAFSGGMESVRWYGLKQDYETAKEQTASVIDHWADLQQLRALASMGGQMGSLDRIGNMMGDFVADGLFPTFKENGAGAFEPITAEILEPSTIAGYVQTSNPEHNLAQYRGILGVPENWRFSLTEAPRDNFADLLGDGLNFAANTPGVFQLSSQMFTRNRVGRDGTVILGAMPDPDTGMLRRTARGLERRTAPISEAVRTELFLTYTEQGCMNADGQLPNAGRRVTPQAVADGFSLKSRMYISTDVRGTAKPVLLLFKTDTPRSAKPIEVCTVDEQNVYYYADSGIVSCCPGNQIYVLLTYDQDQSDNFQVGDRAVYRTGAQGASYLVTVTALTPDGLTVTVQADDGVTLLPCCTGSPDDYGTRGELVNYDRPEPTATCGEVFKGAWNSTTSVLELELFTPILDTANDTAATLTLECGTEILLETDGANEGVFVELTAAAGETFDVTTLDCNCLVNAELCITA